MSINPIGLSVSAMHTRIAGVRFCVGKLNSVVEEALSGGLLVAPSAPGLACDFVEEPAYREALLNADTVLTDSGFLVLIWMLVTGVRIPRHSGLKFIRAVLVRSDVRRTGSTFWVMPTVAEDLRNRSWLNTQGFAIGEEDVYIAPRYGSGPIEDESLAEAIEERRPKVVVIAIGGGVQERLGYYLKTRLTYKPAILCIGAAIAFVTGGQVNIPPWADRLMLGWLFRIASSPSRFFPRYWNAKGLAWLVWKYRDKLPPMRTPNGRQVV